jgi:hypothetical protein
MCVRTLAVALLFAAACAGRQPSPPLIDDATVARISAAEQTLVLERGRPPYRPLRLAPAAGSRQVVMLAIDSAETGLA